LATQRPRVANLESTVGEAIDDDALLAHLRRALDAPHLAYVEPPARILGGFDTLVYSLSLAGAPSPLAGPLILRAFRQDNGPERARFETAVQNEIARQGYPAPRALYTCADPGPLGKAFLIMERLPGRIMLEAMLRPSPQFFRAPVILGELHAKLHGLDPERLLAALEGPGPRSDGRLAIEGEFALRAQRIDTAGLDGLRPGQRWLAEHRPPANRGAILHGDFHPLNILLEGGNVSGVIDWSWVAVGDPAYDVGATVALMTQGPVDLPRPLLALARVVRRSMVGRYLKAYRAHQPLDQAAVDYYEAFRLLGFLVEAGEHRAAELGRIERPVKPSAFRQQHIIESTTRRFEQLTGVRPALSLTMAVQPDVAGDLLPYLRDALDAPDLTFAEPPTAMTGGFETLIYSFQLAGARDQFAQPLVLRIFHTDGRPERVRFERAAQNAIAAQGYPTPRVLLSEEDGARFGAPFVVMERVPGRLMRDKIARPSPVSFRLSSMLAEAQARLHALDAQPLIAALQHEGLDVPSFTLDGWLDQLRRRIDQASLDGLRPGLEWALQHRPVAPERLAICHGDFHPQNVLVDDGVVSGVIDWSLLLLADPALDVGNTLATLTLGPRGLPGWLDGAAGLFVRRFARRYYRAYQDQRPVDDAAVRYYEALRCWSDLVWLGESARGLPTAPALADNPWAGRRELHRLFDRWNELAGVRLELPPPPTSAG
jgi:aminoglycoside phosphotransferase (APT) family kinase protein